MISKWTTYMQRHTVRNRYSLALGQCDSFCIVWKGRCWMEEERILTSQLLGTVCASECWKREEARFYLFLFFWGGVPLSKIWLLWSNHGAMKQFVTSHHMWFRYKTSQSEYKGVINPQEKLFSSHCWSQSYQFTWSLMQNQRPITCNGTPKLLFLGLVSLRALNILYVQAI